MDSHANLRTGPRSTNDDTLRPPRAALLWFVLLGEPGLDPKEFPHDTCLVRDNSPSPSVAMMYSFAPVGGVT
jgi:hypothetical protein